MSFRQSKKKEEEFQPISVQTNFAVDNLKIMKMAGYRPAKGNKRSGFIRKMGKKGARFHAFVYPDRIFLHYDDVVGYKHKTNPHPQLLKGELNRIKEFEEEVEQYIKKKG